MMFGGPLSGKKEKKQCAFLLLWTGEKGRDIFNTWSLDAGTEKDKIEVYLRKVRKHVAPMASTVFSQYKFYNRNQMPGEPFVKFITELRILSKSCDFTKEELTP